MDVPLMKEHRDCHVPAVAIATNSTYEEARAALWHRDLKSPLTSLIFSNPWNLLRAITSLGYTYRVSREWEPWNWRSNRTILLVHSPEGFLQGLWDKHWVVLGPMDDRGPSVYWGDSVVPRRFSWLRLEEIFKASWPTYAITIDLEDALDDYMSAASPAR